MGLREWLGFGVASQRRTVFHLAGGVLLGPWCLIFGFPLYLSGSQEWGYRDLVWDFYDMLGVVCWFALYRGRVVLWQLDNLHGKSN